MGILTITNIEEQIEAIVDSIRETGIITGSSVSNGVATLQSTNNLTNGDIIKISNVDYKVTSVSSTQFSVVSDVDLWGDWKALAPYFMDGHLRDISKRLAVKDASIGLLQFEKYPLVVLLQDFTMSESKANNVETSLNIIIVNNSNPEYSTEDRRKNNFTPVLDPLYNRLIQAIKDDSYMNLTDNSWSLTRRYYWGSELNSKNIFGDFLDAIDIEGLNISVTKKCVKRKDSVLVEDIGFKSLIIDNVKVGDKLYFYSSVDIFPIDATNKVLNFKLKFKGDIVSEDDYYIFTEVGTYSDYELIASTTDGSNIVISRNFEVTNP